MTDWPRILILGGTGEALELAKALTKTYPHALVVTSLAGRTKTPAQVAGALRTGGFGGTPGLTGYLRDGEFTAVIDATHPFASIISRNVFEAAQTLDLPLLRLERPAWQEVAGDNWIKVPDTKAAARVLNDIGSRVLLTTGQKDIADFANLNTLWFLLRLIDPPATSPPLSNFELLLARGPFTEEGEIALMRERKIDVLVTKNSGGAATYGKISAARKLGLPVAMIERPKPEAREVVPNVDQALGWFRRFGLRT